MYKFGRSSLRKLHTLKPELQAVLKVAIKTSPMDFALTCGHRNKEAQERAFLRGFSTVRWPRSRHNKFPSDAVDFVPWHPSKPHVRWEDIEAFIIIAEHIIAVGRSMGVEIEYGGNWRTFKDYPHLQLKRS